jgi:F-type H+-transporting ATPase subunit b
MELLKMLTASEVAAQIISFLILLFLLRAFAWKPILKLLDQRRDNIASELKKIEDDKREAEATKAEFESKLRAIEDVARAEIQEMLAGAEKEAQGIKDDAHREAARIIQKAEVNARYESVKAKEEIKDEVAELVLEATGLLLEEKITEQQDKKLAGEFIERLNKV